MRRGAGDKINKSWVAQYRRAGASRRVLIGNADVISAEAARAAAKKILTQVALGGDPQADRVDRREKDQLVLLAKTRETDDDGKPVRKGVIADYLAAKKNEVRPRTFVEAERYLTGSYFRPLHAKPVDTIKRKDIASCLIAISRKNGSITAARARATISALFTFAMQTGLIEQNPVIGTIQPEDSKARERVLSDEELAAVWRASGDDDYGRIIRLLILTGARRAEIGGLRWTELDPDGKWTLPAERSKNKHAHTLPLPNAAWDIINAVPRLAHRDQLFGVHADEGFTDWGGGKDALDDRLLGKMNEAWTVHDLRRTVSTGMGNIGVQPYIIEQVLNHYRSGHKRGDAGTYNRSSYDREVKAALALWADHVRTLVEGGGRKIVQLPKEAN